MLVPVIKNRCILLKYLSHKLSLFLWIHLRKQLCVSDMDLSHTQAEWNKYPSSFQTWLSSAPRPALKWHVWWFSELFKLIRLDQIMSPEQNRLSWTYHSYIFRTTYILGFSWKVTVRLKLCSGISYLDTEYSWASSGLVKRISASWDTFNCDWIISSSFVSCYLDIYFFDKFFCTCCNGRLVRKQGSMIHGIVLFFLWEREAKTIAMHET